MRLGLLQRLRLLSLLSVDVFVVSLWLLVYTSRSICFCGFPSPFIFLPPSVYTLPPGQVKQS